MQYHVGFAGLLAVVACHTTEPATPAPAGDPVIARVLAKVDQALVGLPRDGGLLYQRASLMIPQGAAPAEALPVLERLATIGWDIPLVADDFGALASDPRYRAIADRIAGRAPRVQRSTVAFGVPIDDLIPEGIAVDPRSGTFYLGSVRKRTIVAIDASGAARTFVPARSGGLLGVTGIKVDPVRGVLWAASHASRSIEGYQPADREAEGAYAFALADGSVRRRVRFADPGPHLANDLAIASDGTAYLTDSASGGVYRIPPDRDALEVVVATGSFAYPNGLALADDHQLYVADAIGIARVALDTGAVTPLAAPPHGALGGIDGMLLDGDRLLAVQNSIGRPQIIAISIAGDRATSLTVLENDPGALDKPTTTCLWHGALYTIANSGIGAFGPNGLRPGRTLHAPRILRTPL